MLPHRQQFLDDYRNRFGILAERGVLVAPSISERTPLRILDEPTLRELSLAFFVGWLLNGILNKDDEVVRAAFLPLVHPSRTLLVVSGSKARTGSKQGSRIAPGRRALDVDREYLLCPLDHANGAAVTMAQQTLCPVVNKLRYNLGQDEEVSRFEVPSEPAECCASQKRALWSYLGRTALSAPDTYRSLLGGLVIPLDLSPELVDLYITGLEADDLGTLFDETLLWYAMDASASPIGLPHAEFLHPFRSNEIDFLLFESNGKRQPRAAVAPPDGWEAWLSDQSLCMFETTVGHRSEEDATMGFRGSDHPKNKLMNLLALQSAGFRHVELHYLSMTDIHDKLAPTVQQTLRRTRGFFYWSLSEELGDVTAGVLDVLEDGIPVATLRRWHAAVVDRVKRCAVDFQRRRRES